MYEEYANKYNVSSNVIDRLYNPKQKLKFIETCYGKETISTIKPVIGFWGSIGKIESSYQKDLMQFNVAELNDVLAKLNIAVKSTFENRKNLIKTYYEWGVTCGLFPLDKLSEYFGDLSFDKILNDDNVKQRYFKNFDELQNCIKTLIKYYNDADSNRYDMETVVIYLLWCGLPINLIYRLEIKNIDFATKTIDLGTMKYKMNDTVANFIENYLNKTSYTIINKGKNNQSYYFRNTGYLLRPRTQRSIYYYSQNTIIVKLSKFGSGLSKINNLNKYSNHSLSLKDVRDSGCFDRIYHFEKEQRISIIDVSDDIFSRVVCEQSLAKQKKAYIITMYKLWKRIFYGV